MKKLAHVEISSTFRNRVGAGTIARIEEAAVYFLNHFDIKLPVRLNLAYTGKRRYGSCTYVHLPVDKRLKELGECIIVNIGYNYNNLRSLLETVAHEFVHAKQFDRKELGYTKVSSRWNYTWNGVINNNKGSTYNAYRKQPWEIEAFDSQAELVDRFLADQAAEDELRKLEPVKPEATATELAPVKVWARGEKTKVAKGVFIRNYLLPKDKVIALIAEAIDHTTANAKKAYAEFKRRIDNNDLTYFNDMVKCA